MQQIILDKTGKLLDPLRKPSTRQGLWDTSMLCSVITTQNPCKKEAKQVVPKNVLLPSTWRIMGLTENRPKSSSWVNSKTKRMAEEYVDNLGGIEQFIDPERYLRVDKIYSRGVMNMADVLFRPWRYELEDRAERHGLKFERHGGRRDGRWRDGNFRREIEEEYDEQLTTSCQKAKWLRESLTF